MLQLLEALQLSVLRFNRIHKIKNNIRHIICIDAIQIKLSYHSTINKMNIILIIITFIILVKSHILPFIIIIHLLISLNRYHKLTKKPSNNRITLGLLNKRINLNIKTMINFSNSILNLGREYSIKDRLINNNLIATNPTRMFYLMNQEINIYKFKIFHNFNSSSNIFRITHQGSNNILNILKALFSRMYLWVSFLFVTKQLSTIAITTILMNPLIAT